MRTKTYHVCRVEGCSTGITRAGGRCRPCFSKEKYAASIRHCAAGCGVRVARNSNTGKCRSCAAKQRVGLYGDGPKPRFPCGNPDCSETMTKSPGKATNLCRRCAAYESARSPARLASVSAKMKAIYADPEAKARRVAASKAGIQRRLQDPAYQAKMVAEGKRLQSWCKTPENEDRFQEGLRRSHRSRVENLMAWCPPAYRGLYRQLRSMTGNTAALAREAVILQIAADARRVASGAVVDQKTFVQVREAAAWVRQREAA